MPTSNIPVAVRQRARLLATYALRRGELTKEPCFVCESPLSEMHHPDYGKPLEIVWVCRRHHRPLFHAEWPGEKRQRKLEAARLVSKQLAERKAVRSHAPFWVDLREFD